MDNDAKNIRIDFPMLINNSNLIYFDNAATSLKPKKVIDAVYKYYTEYTSNVFRGAHINSEIASINYDEVRKKTANLIRCSYNEVVFTFNATDAINKLLRMLALNKESNIAVSNLEHHSNFLPWYENCNLISLKIDSNGLIDLNYIEETLKNQKIELLVSTYASNVTGNLQPVKEIVKLCKKYKVKSLIDASQVIGHKKIDVKDIDCDFLIFSTHKALSPTGVGILYINHEIQDELQPVVFGGGMVNKVEDNLVSFKEIPYCFEAGTPAIESVIGFGAAIDYINSIGYNFIENKSSELNAYFMSKLDLIKNFSIIFPIAENHVPIFTFKPCNNKIDLNYISRILSDTYNIAVNSGYQCCQPLYKEFGFDGGIRSSLYIYNTKEEIDKFCDALNMVGKLM